MSEHGARTRVEPTHPSLPGHFPGKPIVPGVVLLDIVTGLVLDAAPGRRLQSISDARFLRPLAAGTEFDVSWSRKAEQVRFCCSIEGQDIARGRLVLSACAHDTLEDAGENDVGC